MLYACACVCDEVLCVCLCAFNRCADGGGHGGVRASTERRRVTSTYRVPASASCTGRALGAASVSSASRRASHENFITRPRPLVSLLCDGVAEATTLLCECLFSFCVCDKGRKP